MNTNLRKIENLHILFWLIKDLSWAMIWKPLGLFMILPTVAVAFYVCYKSKDAIADFYHNLAVVFWILANSFWMAVEFINMEHLKTYTAIPFGIGLLVIAYYYAFKRSTPTSN